MKLKQLTEKWDVVRLKSRCAGPSAGALSSILYYFSHNESKNEHRFRHCFESAFYFCFYLSFVFYVSEKNTQADTHKLNKMDPILLLLLK